MGYGNDSYVFEATASRSEVIDEFFTANIRNPNTRLAYGRAVWRFRVYRAYIEYAVSTSKLDRNDFGDLQFFACCDAGFRLVSSEQRWETISTQEGLDAYLVHLV